MIVSYETTELQQACFALELAEEQYGTIHAQALIALIADIEAFANAGELADFWGSDMLSVDNDALSLPVGADYQAIFAAVGTRYSRDVEGRAIWTSVTRLKLLAITRCR